MSGNQQSEIKLKLSSIEDAIADIKAGKVIIVVDDEDRENEGDFVAAASKVTPEIINFMAKEGRGLICTPILPDRAQELDLPPMVTKNTDPNHTAFTVSIDRIGAGCTTGISAYDRYMTVQALVDPEITAEDLARPGHIFPLVAKEGGVLRRVGHTEAAVDLARLAGLEPAGVIVEIMNEDGTMARLPQLIEIAEKHHLKIVTIEDLVAYRMEKERIINREESFDIETSYGTFTLHAFKQLTSKQVHLALTMGSWKPEEVVPVRIHSAGVSNDIFHILTDHHTGQLTKALEAVAKKGKGAVIYMNQEPTTATLLDRIKAYKSDGRNNGTSFSKDAKDFGVGAQIIRELGITQVDLLTNNPIKRVGVHGYGIDIVSNTKL